MATLLLFLELAVVVAMIYLGAKVGSIGLGMYGMVGVFWEARVRKPSSLRSSSLPCAGATRQLWTPPSNTAEGGYVVRISDNAKLQHNMYGDVWQDVNTLDDYHSEDTYKFEGD